MLRKPSASKPTDLSRASLRGGTVYVARMFSDSQFGRPLSIEGAIMPNGQKYEDWLKDREGRQEDGENE
jgi:hypothetical protein